MLVSIFWLGLELVFMDTLQPLLSVILTRSDVQVLIKARTILQCIVSKA